MLPVCLEALSLSACAHGGEVSPAVDECKWSIGSCDCLIELPNNKERGLSLEYEDEDATSAPSQELG